MLTCRCCDRSPLTVVAENVLRYQEDRRFAPSASPQLSHFLTVVAKRQRIWRSSRQPLERTCFLGQLVPARSNRIQWGPRVYEECQSNKLARTPASSPSLVACRSCIPWAAKRKIDSYNKQTFMQEMSALLKKIADEIFNSHERYFATGSGWGHSQWK